MATNKSEIVENLVSGPEVVTGPKLLVKKRVDEGEAAVVTLDGRFREILPPGPIFLARYPVFTQCKMYYVATRDRQIQVSTTGELTIMHPAPVLVDLAVIVTYRVVDPKVVALEVDRPLGQLFDFTLEAMRAAVQTMKFDEFLVGGQAANYILQALRKRGLREYLGLELIHVNISHIGANERVRKLMENEGLRQREVDAELREQAARHRATLQQQLDEAYNQRDVAKLVELSPEYMALYKPELFTAVFGNRQATDELRLQALMELARVGAISPSAGTSGGQALTDLLLTSLGGRSPDLPKLPGVGAGSVETASARLRRELGLLKSGGYNTMLKQLETGEYAMVVALKDAEGHSLNIYMICNDRYPAHPPQVMVELDKAQAPYDSALLRNWTAEQSAIDIVDEVINYYEE